MSGKTLARIGAVVFVAVVLTATAVEVTRAEEVTASTVPAPPVTADHSDPLVATLTRCAVSGEAGGRDPECLRAWAENRCRFLAPGARPIARTPE